MAASDRLRAEPYGFEFFQAVRLLHLLTPEAAEVGHSGPVEDEPVRFRALPSTSFPPSAVADLGPTPWEPGGSPTMTVSFFGLIGPKGVLPQPYTEMVMQQELKRVENEPEKGALGAWFDLFGHRLTGLFYRAWEKYRFVVTFERAERDPDRAGGRDSFTKALLSLIGLGTRGLSDRLSPAAPPDSPPELPAARIDDLALLYFSGLISHQNRTAAGLEVILGEYFGLAVEVRQFQGQWLNLEEAQQSRLGGDPGSRSSLGRNVVAGARVWELGSKIRVRLGPLGYGEFRALLPDPERPGRFFALARLVRLYIGADLDFDIQLVLHREAVPGSKIGGGEGTILGWNGWLTTAPLDSDRDDAVFEEKEPDPATNGRRPHSSHPP